LALTKVLYLLLAGSLGVNLWLLYKPGDGGGDGRQSSVKPPPKVRVASSRSAGEDWAGPDAPAPKSLVENKKHLIGIPAGDLSQLMEYDFMRLKCGDALPSYLDLKPQEVAQLNQCLERWLAEMNKLEESSLAVEHQNATETVYSLEFPEEERQKFIEKAKREVSAILKGQDGETVGSILLSHPRFACLRAPQYVEIEQKSPGRLEFDCLEFRFCAEKGNADYVSKTISRYGHLFDFSEWKQLLEK
jgi:hypothetical protein